MTHLVSDLSVAPSLAASVLTGLKRGSAFQKLATQVPLDGFGKIITVLGQEDASWVEEGQTKPINDAEKAEIVLNAKKLARVSLYSSELANDVPALRAAIEAEVADSLSRTFDKTVAGVIDAPAGFSTLKNVDSKQITDYQSFRAAIATRTGHATDGIALNVFELDALHGVVNASGLPALNIQGDYNSGTINGIPYYVFEGGTEALGYVGPFKRAIWGVVEGSTVVTILRETAELPDGTVIALKQKNLIGVLAETRVGFKVYNETEFSKLVETGVIAS